jgi:hypothetical protein
MVLYEKKKKKTVEVNWTFPNNSPWRDSLYITIFLCCHDSSPLCGDIVIAVVMGRYDADAFICFEYFYDFPAERLCFCRLFLFTTKRTAKTFKTHARRLRQKCISIWWPGAIINYADTTSTLDGHSNVTYPLSRVIFHMETRTNMLL